MPSAAKSFREATASASTAHRKPPNPAPILPTTNATPRDLARAGKCYKVLQFAPPGACGVGGGFWLNACRSDACESDSDCPNGICGPAGLTADAEFSGSWTRQCFQAACRTNADCTEHAGGVCTLAGDSCAQVDAPFRPPVFACVYPDGCISVRDCPIGLRVVTNGSAVCVASQ